MIAFEKQFSIFQLCNFCQSVVDDSNDQGMEALGRWGEGQQVDGCEGREDGDEDLLSC